MCKYIRSLFPWPWLWIALWYPLQLFLTAAAIIFFGAYLKHYASALEYEAKMGCIVGIWMTLQVELLIYKLWKEYHTDKELKEQERRNHRECQRRK